MIISGTFTLIRAKVSAIPLMLLRPAARYAIFKTQKENNRPQGGLTSLEKVIIESPP